MFYKSNYEVIFSNNYYYVFTGTRKMKDLEISCLVRVLKAVLTLIFLENLKPKEISINPNIQSCVPTNG